MTLTGCIKATNGGQPISLMVIAGFQKMLSSRKRYGQIIMIDHDKWERYALVNKQLRLQFGVQDTIYNPQRWP